MRRLKNSVKALIIAITLVVVATGTVLGVVLSQKNKNKGNTPAAGFNEIQQKFADDVVLSKSNYSPVLIDDVPFDGICNYEQITEFESNYFVANSTASLDGNESLYIYREKTTGEGYDVKNLSATVSNGGFVQNDYSSFGVIEVQGDYAVIVTSFLNDENQYTGSVFSLVYFGDFDNPVEIFKFDTRVHNCITLDDMIILNNNYFAIMFYDNFSSESIRVNLIAFKLTESVVDTTSANKNYIELNDLIYDSDTSTNNSTKLKGYSEFFTLSDNTRFDIYSFTDNGIKKLHFVPSQNTNGQPLVEYELQKLVGGTYVLETTTYTYSNQPLDSSSIYVDVAATGTKVYKNYSYKTLSFDGNNFNLTDLSLARGYGKLRFETTTFEYDGYYLVCQQKVKDNALQAEYLNEYYRDDGKFVISFESVCDDEYQREYVVYASKNKLVTNLRIIDYSGTFPKNVIEFGSDEFQYELDEDIQFIGDYLVVKYSNHAGIIDLFGNVLFDPSISDYTYITPIESGKFVTYTDNNVYVINQNGEINDTLSNLNSNLHFNKFISNSIDMFVTQNGTNYSLNTFSNEFDEIKYDIDAIESIKFCNVTTLKLTTDEKITLIQFKNNNNQIFNSNLPLNLGSIAPLSNALLSSSNKSLTINNLETETYYQDTSSQNLGSYVKVEVKLHDINNAFSKKQKLDVIIKVTGGKLLKSLHTYLEITYKYYDILWTGTIDKEYDINFTHTEPESGENYLTQLTSKDNITFSVTRRGDTSKECNVIDDETNINFDIDTLTWTYKFTCYQERIGDVAYYCYECRLFDGGNILYSPSTMTFDVNYYGLKEDEYFYDIYSTNKFASMYLFSRKYIYLYDCLDNNSFSYSVLGTKIVESASTKTIYGASCDTWYFHILYYTPSNFSSNDAMKEYSTYAYSNSIYIRNSSSFSLSDSDAETLFNYYKYGKLCLYALYVPYQYTVKFVDDDGTTQLVSKTKDSNGKIQKKPYENEAVYCGSSTAVAYNYNSVITTTAPSKIGYTFKGWKISGMVSNSNTPIGYKRKYDAVNSSWSNIDYIETTTTPSLSARKPVSPIPTTPVEVPHIFSESEFVTNYLSFTGLCVDDGGTVTFQAMWEAKDVTLRFNVYQCDPNENDQFWGVVETDTLQYKIVSSGSIYGSDIYVGSSKLELDRASEAEDTWVKVDYTAKYNEDTQIKDLVTYSSDKTWKDLLDASKVIIENSNNGYIFGGWAVYVENKSGSDYYSDATLINEAMGDDVINLYMIYRKKEFKIETVEDRSMAFGASTLEENNLGIHDYPQIFSGINIDGPGNVYVGDNATITATIEQNESNGQEYQAYVFYDITLEKFGYATGTSSYSYKTLKFRYNEANPSSYSIYIDGASKGDNYAVGERNKYYITTSGSIGAADDDTVQSFSVDFGNETSGNMTCTINIYNCTYTGDGTVVNSSTVTGASEYGCKITFSAVPNHYDSGVDKIVVSGSGGSYKTYCYQLTFEDDGKYKYTLAKSTSAGAPYIIGSSYYTAETKVHYYEPYNPTTRVVNFNNTQITVIYPEQYWIKASTNYNSTDQTTHYELETYLSSIDFGDTYTFTLTKTINGYEYKDIQSPGAGFVNVTSYNLTIYNPDNSSEYKIYYKLTYNRYYLYYAVRDDGHVAYFLVSNLNNDGDAQTVTLQFANISSDLDINVSSDTPVLSRQSINVAGNKSTFTPTDLIALAIAPTDGYLISNLKITINGLITLFDFNLYDLYLHQIGTNEIGNKYSYAYSTNIGGASQEYLGIIYKANDFHNFNSFEPNTDGRCGIYTSYKANQSWITGETASDNNYMFEVFYILISGIYHDVSVDVTTVSYLEFDFEMQSSEFKSLFGVSSTAGSASPTSSIATNVGSRVSAGETKIYYNLSDLTQLSILDGNGDLVSSADYVVYDNQGMLRIIFFGKNNSTFKKGFTIFSTGTNYSNYFTRGVLYETYQLDDDARNVAYNYLDEYQGRQANGSKLNESAAGLDNSNFLTLLKVEDLKIYFAKSKEMSSLDNVHKNMCNARKYVLALQVKQNTVKTTMHSYLFNYSLEEADYNTLSSIGATDGTGYSGSNGNYQLDTTNKLKSWFNITMLTNINYSYNYINANSETINWQDYINDNNDVKKYSNLTKKTILGFGVNFVYYDIPGYYLQEIKINTVDYGELTINLTSLGLSDKTKKSGAINSTYSYEITYSSDDSSYNINIYQTTDAENDKLNKNSIGLVSNDFDVSFYSAPYDIDITYNTNLDSNNQSSIAGGNKVSWFSDNSSYSVGETNQFGKKSQTIHYDSFVKLDYYMQLTGYTFIGWGSQNYYVSGDNQPNRYDSSTNTWSTNSSWFDVTSYFDPDIRTNLLNLIADQNYAYDFYVKSSSSAYRQKTGYFITDTGNKITENYNFWLAYTGVFGQNVGKTNNSLMKTMAFQINLYGIWRANTYAVEFVANDTSNKNGSTSAVLLKQSNLDKEFDQIVDTDWNWQLKLPNGLTNYGNTKTYYCFITFDTNDWYIVDADDVEDKKKSELYSYKPDGSTAFIYDNKLDILVDRYGYSWLGWLTKSYDNVLQGETISSAMHKDMMFGSDYYYSKNSGKSRSKPEFNITLYNQLTNINEVGSEFVYFGEQCIEDEKDEKLDYVFHYHYKALVSTFGGIRYYSAKDYTYANETKTELYAGSGSNSKYGVSAYFDTSLAYENYVIDKIEADASNVMRGSVKIVRNKLINDETGLPNSQVGRQIQLFAGWQMNKYTYVVDVRDNNTTGSVDALGSSDVTNERTETITAYFDDNITKQDGSYYISKENQIDYILSNYIPTRVGYDFLGWSYFYNFNNKQNDLLQQLPFSGEAGKINVLDYTLNQNLISIAAYRAVLYLNGDCNTNKASWGTDGNTINDKYASYKEIYGDTENGHYTYIYAIWKQQIFTINVSLNIKAEDLKNAYDTDSQYAIGFYQDITEASNVKFTGINQSFVKNITETETETKTNYVEVPANLVFELAFDDEFSNAVLRVTNNDTSNPVLKYKLKDLFATSAGYYLLGWMYESGDASTILLANNLKSAFGKQGNLESVNIDGTYPEFMDINNEVDGNDYNANLKLDITTYAKLKNSNYKVDYLTNNFNNSNIYALNTNDGAGTSTNFGVVNISGQNYYLQTERYNEDKQLNYRLFFVYDGVKYYVTLYEQKTDSDGTIVYTSLKNNESFLYYKVGDNEYIIRYTADGKAYYVNDDYFSITYVDVRIAVYTDFNSTTINDDNNKFGIRNNSVNNDYTFTIGETSKIFGVTFVCKTTRQFTLYAHWQVKDDFNIIITNGNNKGNYDAENDEDKPTASSNPGLAGYYEIYKNSDTATTQKTNNEYDEAVSLIYDFYDDLDFDIIPYYNGRYLSEITFDIYKLSEVISGGNTNYMTSNFVNVKYTVTVSFTWNPKTHYLDLSTIKVVLTGISASDYDINTPNDSGYYEIVNNKELFTILDKGTLTDTNVGNNAYYYQLLKVFDYGSAGNYGRTDINKVEFSFKDVMTSIDMTCKFSVQTYQVDFYGVMDNDGSTLKPVAGESNKYTLGMNTTEFENNVASTSAIYNDKYPFKSSSINSEYTLSLATIPQDCATATTSTTYNVPYGYYIYGLYYASNLSPNRSIDDSINSVLAGNSYYGFSHIYALGNYNYGSSQIKIDKNGSDDYFAQCSPLLGSTSAFSEATAVRLSLSFYTFRGWFESTGQTDASGNVMITEYNKSLEATFIKRNITLYGYYYANNKPTSLTFYTWDDNSSSYVEYSRNSEEYTLTSNITTNAFVKKDGQVIANSTVNVSELVDESGYAIISSNNQYGVDGSGFGNSGFTDKEFPQEALKRLDFLNKILQTYWYYQDSYNVLVYNSGGDNYYLKYGTIDEKSGFYYVNNGSQIVKVLVLSDDMANFFMQEACDDWATPKSSTQTKLDVETKYNYNFRGSKLYVKYNNGSTDMYYELKELSVDVLTELYGSASAVPSSLKYYSSGSWVDSKYRYYFEMNGTKYFVSDKYISTAADSINFYNEAGNESGLSIDGTQYTIETLYNYYIKINEKFTKCNFKVLSDSRGSAYVNPYEFETTVKLEIDGTVNTYYLDYASKYLFANYDASTNTYSNRAGFTYRTYSPLNTNYSISPKIDNGWKVNEINVKSLPSPNSGFWYGDNQYGHIGYIEFKMDDLDKLKTSGESEAGSASSSESDGLIYQEILKYINYNYSGRDEIFINNLKAAVGVAINDYSFDDLLKKLLVVNSYKYESETSTKITGVNVNIPIEFMNFEVINELGRTELVSISVVVVAEFKLISTSTVIDTNIYGIPIYSPFMMKYAKDAATVNDSDDKLDLNIDTSKFYASHFETKNGVSYIYDRKSGDYVQFVLLNKDNFDFIYNNKKDISNYMTTLVNQISELENASDRIKSQPAISAASQTITFDMTTLTPGEYFVFAFYYKTNSSSEITPVITRVSDNFVYAKVEAGAESNTVTVSVMDFEKYEQTLI